MKKHQRRFDVEELEPRTVLSAAGPRHLATTLVGTLHGRYAPQPVPVGADPVYAFHGSGKIGGLGQVRLKGSVHGGGSPVPGGKAGKLTVANTHGTLTLLLEDPSPSGAVPLPSAFTFQVLHGTGAYQHVSLTGMIALQVSSDAHFALTIQPGSNQTPPPQPTPVPTITTGVSGTVQQGPIYPVARPGIQDTRPVPGAIISVQPYGGGPEITRTTADAAGNFQIELAPGAYRIVALPSDPTAYLPRGTPQDVVIGPNQVLILTLDMDTGIR
jgi:hypothetical protein